jgi:Transposase, Mutator family
VTDFLGRARYQRTPAARGSRNGVRPRRVQTAEGEVAIEVPQRAWGAGHLGGSSTRSRYPFALGKTPMTP